MKNFLLVFQLFFSIHFYGQNFITVANNPTIDADHSDISSAVAASTSGDTIYIHGGTSTYTETVQINHELHIIGPGYFLDENNEYNTDPFAASVNNFDFLAGSNHSTIEGITVVLKCRIFEDDITIRKNRFLYSPNSTANGPIEFESSIDSCLIYNNLIHSTGTSASYNVTVNSSSNNVLTNILFVNNILGGALHINSANPGNANLLAINNTFMRSGASTTQVGSYYFSNNIFCNATQAYTQDPGTFVDNIFTGNLPTYAPSAAGNVGNIDMNDVFLNYVSLTNNINSYIDSDFTVLEPTPNPATTNCNGIGCGATLGLQPPYRNSGIPEIPILYELSSDAVPDGSGNINITVKAKAY